MDILNEVLEESVVVIENLIDEMNRIHQRPVGLRLSRSVHIDLLVAAEERDANFHNGYVESGKWKFRGLEIKVDDSIPDGEARFVFPRGEGTNFSIVNIGN